MKFYKAKYNENDWYLASDVDKEIKKLENLAVSLNTQKVELQDKLSRRNMQIKDLRQNLEGVTKELSRLYKDIEKAKQ